LILKCILPIDLSLCVGNIDFNYRQIFLSIKFATDLKFLLLTIFVVSKYVKKKMTRFLSKPREHRQSTHLFSLLTNSSIQHLHLVHHHQTLILKSTFTHLLSQRQLHSQHSPFSLIITSKTRPALSSITHNNNKN